MGNRATTPDRSIHNPRRNWHEPEHFMKEHSSQRFLANVFLLIRHFAASMSARSSTLLPWRLASSSGGLRWLLLCSLQDTRSLGMRYYLPRVPHGFSFASPSGSKSQFYVAWCSGELTTSVFGELWFGAHQATELGRCEFCVCQVVCLFKYPWRVK